MKTLLLLAVILAAAAIGYPLANEDATSECSAVERRLITLASARGGNQSRILLGLFQNSISDGTFARSLAKERNPNLPPSITCGIAYWRTVIDPAQAQAVVDRLLAADSSGPRSFIQKPPDEGLLKNLDPQAAAAVLAKEAARAYVTPAPAPVQTANPDQPAPTPAPAYKPVEQKKLNQLFDNQSR